MTLIDLIIIPVYMFIILLIGLVVQESLYPKNDYKWYLVPGLLFKLIGCLGFCIIYLFYYGSGDTIFYFRDGHFIAETIKQYPALGWRLLEAPAGEYNLQISDLTDRLLYFPGDSTMLVNRISAVFNLFGMGNFWATSLLFAAVSYSGLWALYTVFIDYNPKKTFALALAVLFVPSVCFWGAGIMKDTITMGCVGWMAYAVYHLLIKKDQLILPLIFIPICAYLILTIKSYIIIALIPPMFLWVLFHHLNQIKDIRFNAMLLISSIVIGAMTYYFLGDMIIGKLNSVVFVFVDIAEEFQTWHGSLDGSSKYDLGEVEFSLWGVISKVPASINVTLFRPYLFEVRNPVMLISALESTFILLFTLYVVLRTGVFKTLRIILANPFLICCLLFVMIFGFAVGFTSYNFGALVRYKIPCIPFYMGLLVLILYEGKERRKKRYLNVIAKKNEG